MAKTLLRSGSVNDFLALGENGQTLFDSALQIRETLRLRNQRRLADCLAIPQPDENEEKIDWYAPFAGAVTTWSAATPQQREQALRYFDDCLITVKALSLRYQQSEKPSVQRCGALLENIFRFPASQHVYLVDNKPVLTFWGFAALNTPHPQDVFAPLRATLLPEIPPETDCAIESGPAVCGLEPDSDDTPPSVLVTLSQPAPALSPSPEPTAPTQVPPSPAASVWPSVVRRIVLVGVALIALPIAGDYLYKSARPVIARYLSPPAETAARNRAPEPVAAPLPPPVFSSSLPLAQASVVPPVEKERPEPVAEPAITKDALVLPAASVKAGTTAFLNGHWRATIAFRDVISGKPPVLRYQINNNTGILRVTLSDNTTCRTEITSGLMQSGNLVIKNNGKARCTDGSRYTVPEIVCSQGLTGAAQCTGRFDSDTVVPVTFRKVSK